MSALVEELRAAARIERAQPGSSYTTLHKTIDRAADRIAELEAQREAALAYLNEYPIYVDAERLRQALGGAE